MSDRSTIYEQTIGDLERKLLTTTKQLEEARGLLARVEHPEVCAPGCPMDDIRAFLAPPASTPKGEHRMVASGVSFRLHAPQPVTPSTEESLRHAFEMSSHTFERTDPVCWCGKPASDPVHQ